MGIITVEGLGQVEIQGDVPNAEEQKALKKALQGLSETTETETETEEVDTSEVSSDLGDSIEVFENEFITSDMINSNLDKGDKKQGLDKFGLDRSTFEAAGAIFGAVPGATLGPPGVVAAGTVGVMGMGQVYDILQSYIVDEPTDFITQLGRSKDDLQREALLQSFFAKVPGLYTGFKKFAFGKSDEKLYRSAKELGFPLSLSDAGNIISKSYGRVIGVFPYIGNPVKQAASKKADFLNKAANDTLNVFGPNVILTKLGVNMEKAARATYGDFRIVSKFFYDDFYKSVSKVGKTPIISTQNFKNQLNTYIKNIDEGTVKLTSGGKLKDPRKDALYKYAKQAIKVKPYIDATQYKALNEQIKYYMKMAIKSQDKEPISLSVLTGMKGALEKDLRLLTKKSYRDNLLKNVYPLSKSKQRLIDDKLLSDIANKLKFADEVYANGVQNSILSNSIRKKLTQLPGETTKEFAKRVKEGRTEGKAAFTKPVASDFKKIDKNIFGQGYVKEGSITADQLGEALLKRGASPEVFKNLRSLVGEQQFKKFVRSKLQKAYDNSLIKAGGEDRVGLVFDPYKFEQNLGLTTDKGRELLEVMLQGSKLNMKKLDSFFDLAKNHAGLKVPDVSSFVARRAVLGGTRSLVGGVLGTAAVTTNPVIGSALIFMARKTSRFLTNPKQLDDVMTLLDPNTPANQMKVVSLKLIDAMISDSKTKQEENDFKLMRENIELMPLDQIKKGLQDTIESSQEFLNMNEETGGDTEQIQSIEGDTSQLPITRVPPLQTANVNPNLLAQAPTGVQTLASGGDKPYSQMTNAEKLQYDRMVRGLA
jgi:hypothetical protein